MTYDQVLEALRRTPRDWYLSPSLAIRRDRGDDGFGVECPLSQIARDTGQPRPWWVAGEITDAVTVAEVVSAADNRQSASPCVRKDLLEACGLA